MKHRKSRHAVGLACLALVASACAGGSPQTNPTPAADQSQARARAAIAAERSVDPSTIPSTAVGVPPMSIRLRDTTLQPLAFGLADLLATDLAHSNRLSVVERLHLDAVLRELQLGAAGAVDPATAPRVGRIVGARRLVVGGLSEMPNGDLQISVQVADVVSSRVSNAVSARAPLSRIFEAEAALALQVFNALGITLTPAERAAVEAVPTRNVAALLAYSRGLRDEMQGRFGSAADQYRAALRADPNFANARVRLSTADLRASANTGAPNRGERAARGNGAAQAAAAGVNPSLADFVAGGATSAVAVGAAPSLTPAQNALLVTLTIFIQPVP